MPDYRRRELVTSVRQRWHGAAYHAKSSPWIGAPVPVTMPRFWLVATASRRAPPQTAPASARRLNGSSPARAAGKNAGDRAADRDHGEDRGRGQCHGKRAVRGRVSRWPRSRTLATGSHRGIDGVDAPRRHRRAKVVLLRTTGGEASMGEVSTIGLDLAKHVFQVHGASASGAVVVRKKRSSGA